MSYGHEKLLGMPLYGEFPFYIPLALAWVVGWIVACIVMFSRLRNEHSASQLTLGFLVYAGLGVAACRLQFTHIPLKAIHLVLLLTVFATALANVVVRMIIRHIRQASRVDLILGIPLLTLPVFIGVYMSASYNETFITNLAQSRLMNVQYLVVRYHEDNGKYPSEQDWQKSLAPYVETRGGHHGIGIQHLLSIGGCGDFQYFKPRNGTTGDQIVSSVVVEAGQIVPAQKVSIALDGHMTKKRVR